jgi:acyl carrier protein|tara:strand:+ start:552 stop:938 length:387 start_codon:yes stop_codon:yes gene_type:complete
MFVLEGLNMATKYILTKEVILERVKQVIENQLLIEENVITENTILLKSPEGDSLDVDSLDLVELILTFEEAFKIDISDEDASKLLVVKDIVDYVAVALEKKEEDSGKRKKLPGELAQELNLVDPIVDD